MKSITNCLQFGTGNKEIVDIVSVVAIENKEKVLNYLKSFEHDVVCPGKIVDEITHITQDNTLVYYNDGEYYWSESDIYHFDKYNLSLENEFINKVLAK